MLTPRRRTQLFVFGGRYPVENHTKWMFNLLRAANSEIVGAAWHDAIDMYMRFESIAHMFAVEHIAVPRIHLVVIHVSWKAEFNGIQCPDPQEYSTFTVSDATLAKELVELSSRILPKEPQDG